MLTLKQLSKESRIEDISFFPIEPTLNLALKFCIAEGLVESVGESYSLTDEGVIFSDLIVSDWDQFGAEKPILIQIGAKISEVQVNAIKSKWKNA